MPAEWEAHDAIWSGWENNSKLGYYPPVVNIMKTLIPNVTVKMVFNSDSLMNTAKAYLLTQGINSTMLKFYIMPGERYWKRDHGASFLVNAKGELAVADFAWNSYGYPGFLKLKYENNNNSINKYLLQKKDLICKTGMVDGLMAVAENAIRLKTDLKHEGVAIEVNGKGTFILCEATEF